MTVTRGRKPFIASMAAISVLFAVLLFVSIHQRYGTIRTLLYCLIGVAVIWVVGYLKSRLFGWIGPRKENGDTADPQ
jgi:hypothetical protein